METWVVNHFLVIMNNPPVNIHVQVLVGTYGFILLGCIPRSAVAGSCGYSMFSISEAGLFFDKCGWFSIFSCGFCSLVN